MTTLHTQIKQAIGHALRAGLALLLSLGAAWAMSPLPVCAWDPEAGVYREIGDDFQSGDLAAEVFGAENGFAGSWIGDGDNLRAILQHCESRQELLLVFPQMNRDALVLRFNEMVFGMEAFTMRQMGEDLAPQGVGARLTENVYGDCACDMMFGTE